MCTSIDSATSKERIVILTQGRMMGHKANTYIGSLAETVAETGILLLDNFLFGTLQGA